MARDVFMGGGQSLANQFFAKTDTNASSTTCAVWNGSSFVNLSGTDNPGPYAFDLRYQAVAAQQLGFINQGYDGASITALKGGTANMTSAVTAANATGLGLAGVFWVQGETDEQNGMTQATYEGHLIGSSNSVIDYIRANCTNSSGRSAIPFFIVMVGRTDATNDANCMAIRDALKHVAETGTECYYGAQHLDLDHFDGFHLLAGSYRTLGTRLAQTALYVKGLQNYHRGPYLHHAVQVDSTHVDVYLIHRGGSDISPSSAINGFEVKDNGSWVTPSAAVRQAANRVRLTVSSITSLQDVRVFFGFDGGDVGGVFDNTYSNGLLDNSAVTLPVEYASTVTLGGSSVAPKFRQLQMQGIA